MGTEQNVSGVFLKGELGVFGFETGRTSRAESNIYTF